MRDTAYDVFAVTGKNPLLDITLKLEESALADEYFTSRKLYPNVDFYSGLIYQAMGFPLEMFPVLFAIPRTAGWLAHWVEMLEHDTKIARPRQLYIGSARRDYVPIGPLNDPAPFHVAPQAGRGGRALRLTGDALAGHLEHRHGSGCRHVQRLDRPVQRDLHEHVAPLASERRKPTPLGTDDERDRPVFES